MGPSQWLHSTIEESMEYLEKGPSQWLHSTIELLKHSSSLSPPWRASKSSAPLLWLRVLTPARRSSLRHESKNYAGLPRESRGSHREPQPRLPERLVHSTASRGSIEGIGVDTDKFVTGLSERLHVLEQAEGIEGLYDLYF